MEEQTPETTFEAFIAECLPALTRYAYALTRDREASADLVQDTVVKLASAWRRVRVDSNAVAYARTAMLRTYVSRWRWRSRRPATEPYVEEELPGTDSYEQVHSRDLLRRCLRDLPRMQRVVLVLTYIDDLPDNEIADLLRRRPGSVRSLRSRALATVRRQLGSSHILEATYGQPRSGLVSGAAHPS